MTNTETPNTANGGTPSRTETGSAGTDLDGLLREFDTPNPGPKPDTTHVVKALQPVIEFAQTEMNTRAKAAHDGDIKKAVEFVQEEESVKAIPPKVIRGLLEVHAAENPDFAEAFKNRQTDPATWQKQLGTARTAVLGELKSLPGNAVKTDIEAARAAVAGRAEPAGDRTAPSPIELMNMSPRDYEAYVSKQIAANPR